MISLKLKTKLAGDRDSSVLIQLRDMALNGS
jgi:hypothetical protein